MENTDPTLAFSKMLTARDVVPVFIHASDVEILRTLLAEDSSIRELLTVSLELAPRFTLAEVSECMFAIIDIAKRNRRGE